MKRLLIAMLFGLGAGLLMALPTSVAADDDEHPHALAFQSLTIGLGQVPPVASTGRGVASYLVTTDGGTLFYSLEAIDLSSTITAAHIHLGSSGQNGEVVLNLCGAGNTPACLSQGVITTGSATGSSLVGPLAGHPLGDLIVAMSASAAYTNVHTTNFPNGEIRGQVVLVAAVGEGDNGNHGNDNSQGNQDNQGDHDDHDSD